MNRYNVVGIILTSLIIIIIINYTYISCLCVLTNKVCVYIKNESGQIIKSGYLTAYETDTLKFYNLQNESAICLKYYSPGENAFTLITYLSDNKSFQFGPEYSESGYCFDLKITTNSIQINR